MIKKYVVAAFSHSSPYSKKMYWLIHLSVMFVLCIMSGAYDDIEIWRETNLQFIIPGHIIEERAMLTRKASFLWEPKDPKECERIQKRICRNVFRTSYFENSRGERWLDPDVEKIRYPNSLFFSLFSALGSLNCLSPPRTSILSVTGDDQQRYQRLRIDADERSSTFTCHVRVVATGKIREYSVSQPYFISSAEYNLTDVGGRFIYPGDPIIDSIVAFAADHRKVKEIFGKGKNERFEFEDLAKLRPEATPGPSLVSE